MQSLQPESPAHACLVYSLEETHQAMVTSFISQGLTRYEQIIYLLDAHTEEDLHRYLREAGIDPHPFIHQGQLIFMTAHVEEQAYNPILMTAWLTSATEQALREGYTGLRITGETLPRIPESTLIEYEARVNTSLPEKCTGLCQYHRRQFPPNLLLDAIALHPTVIVHGTLHHNRAYQTMTELILEVLED